MDNVVRAFLLPALLTFACVAALVQPSFAQGELKLPLPVPSIQANATRPVSTARKTGKLEVAPVRFAGQFLFDVAVPAGREELGAVAAARAASIESNLEDIIPPPNLLDAIFGRYRLRFDPETFRVIQASEAGYTALFATDASGERAPILTLTPQDASYYGVPIQDLAVVWQERLQTVLGDALLARLPGAFRHQIVRALVAILLMLVGLAILWFARRTVRNRLAAAEDRLELMEERGLAEDPSVHRIRTTITWLATLRWLMNWAVIVLIVLCLLYALYVFPYTEPFARTAGKQLAAIALIWFIAGLVSQVADLAIARLAHAWELRPFLTTDESTRRHTRLPTVVKAIAYGKGLVVYAVAVGMSLGVIGVSATSVITLGAAFAFALSFGAQSLVKDLTNGFFILVEDQYAIGDYVSIDANAGTIEHLTLRTTQLRSDDGRLVTIPNSQVGVVSNWTRSWSRVDFRVALAFDADVDESLAVFHRMLDEAAKDPAIAPLLLGPPRVLGLESISNTGIVLRALVKTLPGKMFEVSRELNRRARSAFANAKIQIGMPVSRVYRDPVAEPAEEHPAGPDGPVS